MAKLGLAVPEQQERVGTRRYPGGSALLSVSLLCIFETGSGVILSYWSVGLKEKGYQKKAELICAAVTLVLLHPQPLWPRMLGQLPEESGWSHCRSPQAFGNSLVAQAAGFCNNCVMALQRPLNPLHRQWD